MEGVKPVILYLPPYMCVRVKTTIIGVRLIGRVVVNIKTCVVIFVASVPWELYAFGRCVFDLKLIKDLRMTT